MSDAPTPDIEALTAEIASAFRAGRERLTVAEAAERAGVRKDLARRLWCSMGLAEPGDRRVCSEADVAMFAALDEAAELLGADETAQLGRVIGLAISRIAQAGASAFRVNVARSAWEEDPTGERLLEANARIAHVVGSLGPSLETILRHHIEAVVRPSVLIGRATDEERVDLAVGFVDLVDSTGLASELEPSALTHVFSEFESVSADVAGSAGARIVKFLGDGVMFVADGPRVGCDVALAIAAACSDSDDLPDARGGVAAGEVTTRDGDYFGPVVHLAARLVKIAEPCHVAVPADIASSLGDAGGAAPQRRELKGIAEPVAVVQLPA